MNIFKVRSLYLAIFCVIFAVGIFLRAYNFSDWLHFELDQARDAKIVDLAIQEGIGNLPLLGPKAAGSFLRLGPFFYYTEYLSAIIFGNTPAGIAMLSLILACFSIALFYFLVKRFFNEKISLMATALFAGSFFLVMYSRFAWNPNSLPFFVLLTMYALLRAVDHDEKRRGVWLVLASVGLSMATQLHFVAFLGLPTIGVIFLILRRPKIKLVFWLGAIATILIFYSPAIINDIKTGGSNIQEFKEVFAKKSSANNYTLIEKIAKNAEETILGYFLILSGYPEAELPKINAPKGIDIQIICTDECKKNLPMGIVAVITLISGLLFSQYSFIRRKDIYHRDFILLVGLWFLVSLVLFVPIAFDLAPRFLLFVAPLPFIFFAFILDFLEKRRLTAVAYLLVIIIIGLNGWEIRSRFQELKNAATKNFKPAADRVLKEKYRVTLEQQQLITDYIGSIQKKNKFPVYLNSEAFYRRAFLYHLEKKKILRDDFRNVGNIYQNGNYFLVYPVLSNLEKRLAKYQADFTIVEAKEFGTLKVFHLVPKEESVKAIQQDFSPKKKATSAPGVPVRCRWNEIFKECNPEEIIGNDNGDDGEIDN